MTPVIKGNTLRSTRRNYLEVRMKWGLRSWIQVCVWCACVEAIEDEAEMGKRMALIEADRLISGLLVHI